jgi:hypothetical protein
MSLVVSEDTRNIAACVFVKEGQADRLEFGVPLKKPKKAMKKKTDKTNQSELPAVSQAKKTKKGP